MKKKWIILIVILLVVFIGSKSFFSKYNKIKILEVTVEEKWAQVENQYQRRHDLIPNLVNTVKGYAKHESQTLQNVVEARSKVGGVMNIDENLLKNPQAMQKFQAAQSKLSSALQRLMVVVEKYPDLKANQQFLSLQDQLEGTENRISQERRRFNLSVKDFNKFIVVFPNKIIANIIGTQKMEFFKSDQGAKDAPKVNF